MLEPLKQLRQHLLTGVSYAIPFVACGGILIAIALGLGHMGLAPTNPDTHKLMLDKVPLLKLIETIGGTAMNLLLPILGAYIAFSIAGRPGLCAGAVGGFLCLDLRVPGLVTGDKPVVAGFLGAIVAGLLAGFVVQLVKKLPVPNSIRPVMPILVIPVLSTFIVGAMMILLLGPPIAGLMIELQAQLLSMKTGNQILLAALLGAMIAFDMGGPVNKAAFFFASAMIDTDNGALMGPVAAAICTPPLGLGVATLLGKKWWTQEQRESGKAAVGMGLIGITEGAIPFAAADPFRVIPCIMLGSMVASVIAMLSHVTDGAPHGGPIVLLVVGQVGDSSSIVGKVLYLVAILAGTGVTAASILLLKRLGGPPDAAVVDAPNEPVVPSLSAAKDSR